MRLLTCGLFLTGRQLDEHPELMPVKPIQQDEAAAGFDRARALVRSEHCPV